MGFTAEQKRVNRHVQATLHNIYDLDGYSREAGIGQREAGHRDGVNEDLGSEQDKEMDDMINDVFEVIHTTLSIPLTGPDVLDFGNTHSRTKALLPHVTPEPTHKTLDPRSSSFPKFFDKGCTGTLFSSLKAAQPRCSELLNNMVYSSDYLPGRSVGIPGPPGQLIASLLPEHIHWWIEEQETHGIVPTAATIAVLAPAEVGPRLLKRNTLIIPGDNISGHRLAVTALAEAFVSSVALPWTHEWKKRVAKAGCITRFTPDIVHDGDKTPELVTSPAKRDHIAHKGYLHSPSPVTANEKPPTPKPIENPSTIPDFLFDSWLRLKLEMADQADMQPQCNSRKVPAMLFDMVDNLQFPGDRDTMRWAQCLIDTAFAVPPSHLHLCSRSRCSESGK
ncbi:hypothetical protein JB92DRAFT_2830703 [Gautieria morchelliformis]|nr:hypothetical protein JB92DRAFT_2830703 [Gautieria morchelliformis]